MQPDYSGRVLFPEVAEHRLSGHRFQVVPVLSLGEDAVAQRPGVIAALDGFGHLEDYFAWFHHQPRLRKVKYSRKRLFHLRWRLRRGARLPADLAFFRNEQYTPDEELK